MEKHFKENLLAQDVKMDACIDFQANGNINIYPCPWEDDKQVTDGSRVSYKGRVEVDEDGHTRVKRYNIGAQGPKHDVLFETLHGVVKITRPQFSRGKWSGRIIARENVYMTFKFPKKMGLHLIKTLFSEECDEMIAFMKTRKEETIWK